MKHDAFYRVACKLRDVLKDSLEPLRLTSDPVFIGPLDDANINGAALILFLYRVVPNPSLRNLERRVPSSKPPAFDLFRSAVPFDLHFLLTVGSMDNSGEEQRLKALGAAMQALQVDPELNGPDVDYEPVRVTLEPLTTEEASRIWSLFPNANYRTSVAYIASPVWLDPEKPDQPAPRVRQDQLQAASHGAEGRR